MFFYEDLRNIIKKTLYTFKNDKISINKLISKRNFSVELPNISGHGDLSTNVAMLYSKELRLSPTNMAEKIKENLLLQKFITKVEIKNPGFLNIFLEKSYWHKQLKNIFLERSQKNISHAKKVNIEYVSANPTGLMHIGHARGAVLGDTIASLLNEVGHSVTKEYYINDAGNQIRLLTNTVIFHIENIRKNTEKELSSDLYPGEYLKNVAKKIFDKNEKIFNEKINSNSFQNISKDIVDEILFEIKKDLSDLGVFHDIFSSEKELTKKEKVSELISLLREKNLIYEGFQEQPKGTLSNDWKKEKQLLFKSKTINDDSDRALIKPDGSLTYFMSDIIYHQQKIKKNFDILINVWGIDHSGYVARITNAVNLISNNINFVIKLTALVNLIKNKKPLKMSKRRGVYITLREVLSEVGKDALRFMMVSRSPDKVIDFDFDLIKSKSRENQVFYVQYAYARCCSVERIGEEIFNFKIKKNFGDVNLNLLELEEELNLIKNLASYEKILNLAAKNFEPHRLTNFLYSIAKLFHNYWSLGTVDSSKRVINTKNSEISKARLILVLAVKLIIEKGLKILDISTPNTM